MPRNTASGRFLLRVDPSLHAALRREAATHGLSLNAYCAQKLASPSGRSLEFPSASEAVRRVDEMFGNSLVGIAVFGSWARGEATEGSNVDVLIVVDKDFAITRSLYRDWDDGPLPSNELPVDPHIVHLPTNRTVPSALWAEVAVNGIVVFEHGLRLSRHLAAVRRFLADGQMRRQTVHGKGYWTDGHGGSGRGFAVDDVRRATVRLQAIAVLHRATSWADVVRESQETAELALKGLLRSAGIEPPHLHDVSAVLVREQERLPESVRKHVDRMAAVSRDLRRDRELAFYGAEDLIPSDFYGEPDALRALEGARFVVDTVASVVTASD